MNKIKIKDTVFSSDYFSNIEIPNYYNKSPNLQKLYLFLSEWFSENKYIQLQTSGSTGIPKLITVEKSKMLQSAAMTCKFFDLKANDKALLCLSTDYIAGKMMVVRAIYSGMNLYPQDSTGHPLSEISPSYDFAAMVPLQVYNSIKENDESERLSRIRNLIIGGGAIDSELEEALRDFPNSIYSTYGMTETLSHIGLRKINGEDADKYYTPLPGVNLKLSDEQTLVIDAPLIADELIVTNDIAEIRSNGTFRILGRKDNVVNTGGVKIQIEAVENQLRPYIKGSFAITSIPHPKLGEAIVLLVDENNNKDRIKEIAEKKLPRYHQPLHIITVNAIPVTGNGKTDRATARKLAQDILSN